MVDFTIKLRNIIKLVKFSESNMEARKLNEPFGFLVSSLDNLVSRSQVNHQEKYKDKKTEKEELYTCDMQT